MSAGARNGQRRDVDVGKVTRRSSNRNCGSFVREVLGSTPFERAMTIETTSRPSSVVFRPMWNSKPSSMNPPTMTVSAHARDRALMSSGSTRSSSSLPTPLPSSTRSCPGTPVPSSTAVITRSHLHAIRRKLSKKILSAFPASAHAADPVHSTTHITHLHSPLLPEISPQSTFITLSELFGDVDANEDNWDRDPSHPESDARGKGRERRLTGMPSLIEGERWERREGRNGNANKRSGMFLLGSGNVEEDEDGGIEVDEGEGGSEFEEGEDDSFRGGFSIRSGTMRFMNVPRGKRIVVAEKMVCYGCGDVG
ncbi:uncharacterized protein EI90DRAFT_192206 [Cantharellus anzutake]|uniref:uncharacterized protein n=1 Tax=Cantharellus anzutake TaxID=1750568 RepID=UPI0019088625|nr:uncharacterized protein EI90DRAFT_192206 [Cantharellus anzutake]KAF8336569.1 hypothetical protein EI90DRAFT_192206 [Cantharellus anzutake]